MKTSIIVNDNGELAICNKRDQAKNYQSPMLFIIVMYEIIIEVIDMKDCGID